MALPLPPGLTPSEVGFLCEMELVNVIPRQRLEGLELLGGPTTPLQPPFQTPLPLWLALLLKRQRRANISPPPWLTLQTLQQILDFETSDMTSAVFSPSPALPPLPTSLPLESDPYLSTDHNSLPLSPPFQIPQTGSRYNSAAARQRAQNRDDADEGDEEAARLPFHWQELSHLLLTHAADDVEGADAVRILLRDIREVRGSKLRRGFRVLEAGGGVKMNGVGAMEVAEVRGFVGGVVDGLRRINRSREEARREREAEDRENGIGGEGYEDDEDDMQL